MGRWRRSLTRLARRTDERGKRRLRTRVIGPRRAGSGNEPGQRCHSGPVSGRGAKRAVVLLSGPGSDRCRQLMPGIVQCGQLEMIRCGGGAAGASPRSPITAARPAKASHWTRWANAGPTAANSEWTVHSSEFLLGGYQYEKVSEDDHHDPADHVLVGSWRLGDRHRRGGDRRRGSCGGRGQVF